MGGDDGGYGRSGGGGGGGYGGGGGGGGGPSMGGAGSGGGQPMGGGGSSGGPPMGAGGGSGGSGGASNPADALAQLNQLKSLVQVCPSQCLNAVSRSETERVRAVVERYTGWRARARCGRTRRTRRRRHGRPPAELSPSADGGAAAVDNAAGRWLQRVRSARRPMTWRQRLRARVRCRLLLSPAPRSTARLADSLAKCWGLRLDREKLRCGAHSPLLLLPTQCSH